MNFYNVRHKYYCGIDLHSKTMYLCIMDETGEPLLHRNIRNSRDYFLKLLEPYREDVVVGAECVFCWYWLADVCAEEKIPFVLGHALYMKAIHGGKAKSDRIDSKKIADLLRGGLLPTGYVYPKEMRSARDLMRRRTHFVRHRGELLAHTQLSRFQHNLPEFPQARISKSAAMRQGIPEHFPDKYVRMSVEANLRTIDHYDGIIRWLEKEILKAANKHEPDALRILQTVPGIGEILAMTILYEIHTMERFSRVQDFLSYSRLVKCRKMSAGKDYGSTGKRIGNPHLKWAFSEAVVRLARSSADLEERMKKLERKHGKGKALSILSAELGRAVYIMLKRKRSFDIDKFLSR